jgi:hypothetical protein
MGPAPVKASENFPINIVNSKWGKKTKEKEESELDHGT